MEDFSLRDLLTILKRRRRYFFITAALVFAVTSLFTLGWSKYRSTATVQIEQSYVPASIAVPAGGHLGDALVALADRRLSHIEQTVTSMDSLSEIIAKYKLYEYSPEKPVSRGLTDTMRSKIKLNLMSGIVSSPAAATKETAEQLSAIAFSLSFEYSDPRVTKAVLAELVTRFVDEDISQRRMQARETSSFLASQIAQLETSMAEQEKTIAEFRATHGESGAAALMFNQQANVTATLNLQNIEGQLAANEGTQGNLRAQMATVEPYSRVLADGKLLTTPAAQLKALESQYASLSAQYGQSHPDVIKARRQIASLKEQIGQSDTPEQLEAQITDAQTRLATLQKTYGPEYPDIVSLEHRLQKLEERRASQLEPASGSDNIKHDADNPAYLQLVAQFMSAQEQHKSLLAQKEALIDQQAKYAQNILENPIADREMAKLSRDYDNAQLRYRELKEKKMSADMMEQLEEQQKGQRMVVINPPSMPGATTPPRSTLMLGGMAFALLAGFCSAILIELMTPSVHSARHLASLVGAMPLVVVPYIYTDVEASHPLRRWQTLSGIRQSLTRMRG